MKPYYENELVTIYNADCMDVFADIGYFDLLLTDPPYGIDYQSNGRTDRFEKLQNDNVFLDHWLRYVQKADATCLFTRWDVQQRWIDLIGKYMKVRGSIVWHKPGGGMGDLKRSYALDYELAIYASVDGWSIPGKRYGSVWTVGKDAGSEYEHPTQKPVALMEMCIDRFLSGDTVCDPFLGSGTTALACMSRGKKCIGVEINEHYAEVSAQRCDRFKTGMTQAEIDEGQQTLFGQ